MKSTISLSSGGTKDGCCPIQQAFIYINTLDELARENRPGLLKSLRDIVLESPSIQVFAIRKSCVGEKIRRYFNKAIVIPDSPDEGDVPRYLEAKLDRSDPDQWMTI